MIKKLTLLIKSSPLNLLLIIFTMLIVKELIYINTFRDEVSPIADGYSEANAIRGAVFFYEKGITSFYGLPNIGYSDLLSQKGVRGEEGFSPSDSPYTHYPPGPEYLTWLGFQIFGSPKFNLVRLIPITFSIIAGIFFIQSVFQVAGGGFSGAILGCLLILPPMFSNYMHGLHYQQYAFIVLQFQIVLALKYSKNPRFLYLFFFLLAGFLQGWLSFDYAFLASLFFIPFCIYFHLPLSELLKVCFASGFGFTLAHALHFLQVINYMGSLEAAVEDFRSAAAHRSLGTETKPDSSNGKFSNVGPFTVIRDYLYRVSGRGKYLAINLMNFIWIIISFRFIRSLETKRFKLTFEVTTRDLMALLSAILISGMWSLVMRQHAHIHGFVARHYYFCYFFCCLILVTRTSVLKKDQSFPVSQSNV